MAQAAQARPLAGADNEAQRIFRLQREACLRDPYPSLEVRRDRLRALDAILTTNADAICEAIREDFGHRSAEESKILELFPSVDGIRHALKKLPAWMRPERRHVSWLFATGSNRVLPQPKGVVGIVAPWNYPLFLTVSPLTGVLAAGNRAMIKMARNSRQLCRLLHEKFGAAFPQDAADLPRAGLRLRSRGEAGAVRRRGEAHPARTLPGYERPRLYLDHRRQILPAAARDPRRCGAQGRDPRAARAGCFVQ